jgi:hypothetical protein
MPLQDQKKPQDETTELDRLRAESIRLQNEIAKAAEQRQQQQAQSINPDVPAGYSVVKVVPEKNGMVYRSPDGKLAYVERGPDGGVTYASNNEAEVQRIIQGEAPRQAQRTETQKQILEQSGGQAAALSAVKGIPFVGEYLDEAVGAMTGDPRTTAAMREMSTAYEEQKPLEAFGGQAALGAIATAPLIPFQAAGRAIQAAPTLLQGMFKVGGAGAVAGATEGAVASFGAGEGTAEQRLPSAGVGAGVGGLLGGTIGALAAPVEMGVKNALQYFGNKPVRDLAKQFGISPDAAKVVLAAIQDNDITTAQAALQRAGSASMLAEMTPSTKNLLDAAIALGSGGDKAQAALLARNLRGEQEMRGAFNRFLGQPEDIVDVTGNIRQASSAQRQQMYDAAYNKPIDYSTLAGRQLENWQRLIPAEALNYANKIRSMDPNARAPQILFKQNADGTISFEELPNVEQWDLITRGLNEMAYGSPAGVMGGKSEVQSLAAKNAREIRKLVMEQVPEYRAALGLARETIEEVKAAELGFDMLSGGVTVKEVRDMLSGQNPAAVQSMKLGLRSGLDHTLGNLKVSAANPNTEIKELMAGLSALRSRNNMSKVRALLGDADADEFYKVLDEQATGIELAAAVATNSKTAQRQAVGRTVEEVTAPGILGTMMRGEPVNASKMVVQSITGKTPEADAARRMGLYDDIATVLTRVQGQNARDALNLIQQAKAGRVLSDEQARIVAKAVTAPAAIGVFKAITAGENSKRAQSARPYQAGMGRPE